MEPAPHSSRLPLWLVVAAVLVFGVVLWGGYSREWPWTGINGHTATLWDWLHLLLVPLLLPIVVVPFLVPMAQARTVAVESSRPGRGLGSGPGLGVASDTAAQPEPQGDMPDG